MNTARRRGWKSLRRFRLAVGKSPPEGPQTPPIRETEHSSRCGARRVLRVAALVTTLAVVIGTAACTAGTALDTKTQAQGTVFPASQVDPLVAELPQKTPKALPTTRLAEDLVPPTNRWFSGLVFGDEPQPVFPLPLTFGLTDSGFSFGLPTVTASEKAIIGGYKPEIAVTNGAKDSRVSAYDTLTVTVDSLDGSGQTIGKTTIAQGSPYVRYVAETDGEISTNLPFTKSGNFWTLKAGETTYGLLTDGSVAGGKLSLNKGQAATWFVVPSDGDAAKLADLAKNPVSAGTVDYSVAGEEVTTTLGYQAEGGTAFAAMPHQTSNLAGTTCDLGTYPSVYGKLTLCSGNELSFTAPVSEPTSALDVEGLSSADKTELSKVVEADITGTKPFPADTYFGGKALYRAAMLLQLAEQLELTAPAETMRTKLTAELTKWTEPQGCATRQAFCFVYDGQGKGVVGLTPSFGSDEYNDHHFHYGYFLYAAGIVAQNDPALAEKLAPVMNLLAADIGSNASNGSFPDRRVFDAYAGHSWASGTAPFADGNNQESSSEAITAWTGLALWAKASGNADLETEATWMLSSEAQSGLAYWTNFDKSDPVYKGFGHEITSLNWGGKRDYATWFSPEPAAMLGILVIPMSPASTYLGGDAERIKANVAEATGGKFDQKFGDYLLMYSALAGDAERQTALEKARTLDAKWIDDGNSRAYMLAWLMTAKG
jgi:endo-1,3(4)-beta-glucanase